MKAFLVGLPGFELCLQSRADTTIAQTVGRAINHYHIGSTNNNENQVAQHQTTCIGGIMFAMEATELQRRCEWLRCLHQQTIHTSQQ